MVTPQRRAAASAADKPAAQKKATQSKPKTETKSQTTQARGDDALTIEEQGISNPGHRAEPEDMTHEVLRTVVVDGAERTVGESVHLEDDDARELESHGYVRKISR
jgi:hypothetical protein